MKKNLKIKAFAKTVRLFVFSTLLAAIILGIFWGIMFALAYLIAEGIITPFTVGVVFFAGVLICAFKHAFCEMYKKLKDEEELKE